MRRKAHFRTKHESKSGLVASHSSVTRLARFARSPTNKNKKTAQRPTHALGTEVNSRMLVFFVSIALESCNSVVSCCLNLPTAKRNKKNNGDLLSQTLLFNLLPLLSSIADKFSDSLWFAAPILPFVVKLTASMDDYNKSCEHALASEREFNLSERREIQQKASGKGISLKAEGNSAIPKSNTTNVKATFDFENHSDDMHISDLGNVLKSTSATNQYCLLSEGVKSGIAIVEMKLVADSDQDECR